jgi:hypothetical protein
MPEDKPNPLEDVRKGLGLLFRAAKNAVEKLPTKEVESAVVSTAREVGRAVGNVATTIEREVFGKKPPPAAEAKGEEAKQDAKEEPKPEPDADAPKPPTGAA